MHRPYYCSWVSPKKRCSRDARYIRKYLEEIMYKFKVDLFLSGHNHYYERSLPVYKNKVDRKSLSNYDKVYTNPKYPTHVTCGISGSNAFRPTKGYKTKSFAKKVSIKIGLCQIKIRKNILNFNFIQSKDDKVIDSFKIIKTK